MALVLIVEDEPTIAWLLGTALSEAGHEVEITSDGVAGLIRLERPPCPQVVLVDLFMPGLDGRALVLAMREREDLKDIPVILITGASPHGACFPPVGSYQATIFKPFDMIDVTNSVDGLLLKTGLAGS